MTKIRQYLPKSVPENAVTPANPIRFSSEFYDSELGLVYYNYRHYSPLDGRFLSRDPIEEQGGFNLYAFVRNNALSKFDFHGQISSQEKACLRWVNDVHSAVMRDLIGGGFFLAQIQARIELNNILIMTSVIQKCRAKIQSESFKECKSYCCFALKNTAAFIAFHPPVRITCNIENIRISASPCGAVVHDTKYPFYLTLGEIQLKKEI